jgi:hypothetical protein
MKKNSCFGALYKFELKKLLRNKVTVVTFLILFAYSLIQGEFEVRGNIDPQILSEYDRINYRTLDDELLGEWYAVTDEYGTLTDDKNVAYDSLKDWIVDIRGDKVISDGISADELYAMRLEVIDEAYSESYLDEEEIRYWKEMEEQTEEPVIWHDSVVASGIQNGISNTMIMMLFLLGIGLASGFSVETQRKTDPMIRSCINGEKELYFAKILAGMTFCLVSVSVLLSAFLIYVSAAWGISGMDISEITLYPFTQMGLTVGQVSLILIVLTVLGCMLLSAFSLFVSEVTRNGVATMGILFGSYFLLFAAGVSIPMKMKTLSKWISLLPSIQVSPRLVYEYRLFKIGGHFFRSYQVAGVMYALLSVIFIAVGFILYRRYEIKSN